MVDEHLCISIRDEAEDTEFMLDKYSAQGWDLVCSYARGRYLIMRRKRKDDK
jgi:hypothetical protein